MHTHTPRARADVRNLLPDTLDVANLGLTTELSFGTDFSGDLLDFGREDGQLVNHAVDSVDEIKDLSRYRHARDLLRQVTLRDRTLEDKARMSFRRRQTSQPFVYISP